MNAPPTNESGEPNVIVAEERRLREVLEAIAVNAESWHGDDAAKGRSLAVIAKTAREALDA